MQTSYIREDDKFEIKIEFPREKFDEYLKQVRAAKIEKLSENQVIDLLRLAYEDYKKGNISLDGLSVVANELFNMVSRLSNKELVLILEEVGDMAYQERQGELTEKLAEFLEKTQ